MKKNARKKASFIPVTLFLIVVLAGTGLYLTHIGKPSILKAYIATGTGNCQTAPIFCMAPGQEITVTQIDKDFLKELTLYKFPDMEIHLPKDFTVIHERLQKVYFKKWKQRCSGATAFLLNQPPDYFIHLFPQVGKRGIKSDYEFLDKTMSANLNTIKDTTDAFFVIVKGIFIPDLGDQKTAKMIKFTMGERKGFLNYNITPAGNYFDCNLISEQRYFLKVYIKDIQKKLDLEKVFTILSTLK